MEFERLPPPVDGGLTAHEKELEEGSIYIEYLDRTVKTLGGTVTVCERGAEMAEIGWVVFRNSPNSVRDDLRPPATVFVKNGGPSTPAIAYNAQIWGGPLSLIHNEDGHLSAATTYESMSHTWAFNSDVVYFDPVGTGISRLSPEADPSWHKSVQKDAEIFTAFAKWYIDKMAPIESPVILAGSSFDAMRTPLSALMLDKQDVHVAGLFILCGGYSMPLDYNQTADMYPFTSALPAIAMSNYYHLHPRYASESADADLFQKVRMFSEGPYADLLTDNLSGHRKDTVIGELGRLSGLDMHGWDDLRIAPHDFATKRFAAEGKALSMLDGRLLFDRPTEQPRVELKLDAIEPIFLEKMREAACKGWIPKIFASESYQGIQPYAAQGDWNWDVTSSRGALEELLTRRPTLRVVDLSGFYDLTCPPPRQSDMLNGIAEKTGVFINNNQYPIADFNPAVDVLMGPHGHQFGADYVGRTALGLSLSTLVIVPETPGL